MSSAKLDKDDIELFRNAVGKVNPVKQDKIYHQPGKPAPVPGRKIADESEGIDEMANGFFDTEDIKTGGELLYRKSGIQNRVFQKLRRGRFTTTAELDLHGLTIEAAKNSLADFLGQCVKHDQRCVRIIHGKGLRSKNGKPVIKNNIGKWLQQRPDVLAYCSAKQVDGGAGALYVLIKKN